MRKPRSEMIAETRAKLLATGRKAFGSIGYAEASMDDFTAEAGLTRGALYHHFGDKKGLLSAVVAEIDAEMTARLCDISSRADLGGRVLSRRISVMCAWLSNRKSSGSCFATDRRCWVIHRAGQMPMAVFPLSPEVWRRSGRKAPSVTSIRRHAPASSMQQAAAPPNGSPIPTIPKPPRSGRLRVSGPFWKDYGSGKVDRSGLSFGLAGVDCSSESEAC